MALPTIKDIAKQAGVGIGTVSRVLNNHPSVSPQTRERVLQVMTMLEFQPNSIARRLPRKIEFQSIGVISQPLINYHVIAERMRGVQLALSEGGYEFELVLYSAANLDHYNAQLQSITQTSAVRGLIIVDIDVPPEQQALLERAQIPFVGLNNLRQRNWVCVGIDNEEGGYLATRHLIEYGHQHIAYVGDKFFHEYGFITSQERYRGYAKALQEAHLPLNPKYVRLGDYGYQVAYQLMQELLALSHPPTAVFAMSDQQALGCIAAIREAGLRVPEDISVIGFDDLEVSFHVGLTSVKQHLELGGRVGVDYLLSQIYNKHSVDRPQLPPVEVVIRHTTAPLMPSRL